MSISDNLSILAQFNFSSRAEAERALPILQQLVTDTRQEDGCIRYELHQSKNNPAKFAFVELWENREKWLNHMSGSAIAKFGAARDMPNMQNFSLMEMDVREPRS